MFMLQKKDLAKKIGINLIYFIGISLLVLLVLLVYGHPHVPALPFTIFFIIIFGFGIFICNFFTGTKYENAKYFNPEYKWKYHTIPFIIFCLIVFAIYWQETLQILSRIFKS